MTDAPDTAAREGVAGRSWFSPAQLRDLFLRPRDFFARRSNVDFMPAVAVAIVLSACFDVMGKIDQKSALVESGHANEGTRAVVGWMTQSWSTYWGTVVVIGLLGTVLSWYIGGWWYGLRLRWSGASAAPWDVARRVVALQSLVESLPTLLIAISETIRFSDYNAASQDDSLWLNAAVPLLFVVWSCWTSYCAATTVFPGARSRGWLWFLVLPLTLYVLGSLGTVALLLKQH